MKKAATILAWALPSYVLIFRAEDMAETPVTSSIFVSVLILIAVLVTFSKRFR